MSQNIRNRRVAGGLRTALTVVLAVLAVTPVASSQQNDAVARGEPHAAAVSLQGLLRFLENYKRAAVPEAMVLKLIDLYGLDFRPTPEDFATLRQASASDALLEAVEAARKPLPPKPVATDGYLAVVCAPVDCDVSVNGNPAGKTSHGLLPLITRPRGPVTVTASRDSYEAGEGKQEAEIRPNEIARVEFHFSPSHAALVSAGTALLKKMLDSLGGGEAELKAFQASGTLYLQHASGYRTAWSLSQWLQVPGTSRFEVGRFREKYEITRTDTGVAWKKRPKAMATQEELEEGFRLLADAQLPRLVEQFRAGGITAVVADLNVGIDHPAAFRVEAGSRTYTVTLDHEDRPAEIRIESSDPASALSVMYSDYAQQEKFCYPRFIQIIRPDGVSGVEARLEITRADPDQISGRKPRVRR